MDLASAVDRMTSEQQVYLYSLLQEKLGFSLQGINLEAELLEQYRRTERLFAQISEDYDVPSNQKAQVVNACHGLLKTLADLQESVAGTEKVKQLQRLFVETLKELPNAEEALAIYAEKLKR